MNSKENKRKEWLVLFLFGAISIVMLYGFGICPKGGLLTNGLMDQENFYFKSEQVVRGLKSEGFEGGDQFSFVIPFNNKTLRENLFRVLNFHEQVQAKFGEYGVLSLANSINYPEGEGVVGDPYIYPELLSSQSWNEEKWQIEVTEDSGVFGFLIGENFDYAQVVVFLPSDYNEIDIRNRVASLLEKREVITWEWFVKSDINPAPEYKDIMVSGWPFGRGLMDAALISDILWYSTIGLTVVLLILYPLLGSKRQALYCWLVVVLGLFWVRGTVGILDLIGFELEGEPIKERVYILLVFTAVIIAGISFSTRKLDSYNSKRCDYPDLTRKNIWKMTQRFNGKIYIVAVIAIASFLTLYSIQIRGITEMGILSAFGIVYLVAMTKWLIPALQIVFGGDIKVNERGCLLKIGDRFLDIATKACFWILTRVSPKATFWIASFFALIIVFGALAIVAHDYKAHKIDEKMPLIKTGTNPIDYLRGTIVDRARLFLNDSERYGFGKLSVLVRPETGDVYNPEFIEKAYLLQKKAKEIEGIRTCKSVLDTVILISKKQYGLNYPETEQQVFDILSMIEWDLGSELFSQLIYSGGVNIVLSLTADNSDLMEKQSADMIELAERYGFIVQPFGRLHYYHQTDKYIQRGQPLNMMTSFWVVVIACCFWIGYRKLDFISSGSYELNSFMAGFAMVVPFVFASSCIVYLMVICDIPLDQSMACFTPLAINAAIDFNLHFMDDFNEALMSGEGYLSAMKTALVKKGKINIVDIVVNATCFAFLIFSNFSPISLLGWLLVIMMFACGFGALVIMPAILYICVRPVKKSII